MSRAFVKDDAPDTHVFIPPRAPLPPGATNYVTPRGLALLQAERAELEAERDRIPAGGAEDTERTRQLTILNGRIADLGTRIATARVIDPQTQPPDEVRFGATVTVRNVDGVRAGEERRFTIVGVDEAAASEGRIAFTAPIARVVTGRTVGQRVSLHTAGGAETLEVAAIAYAREA